MARIAANIKELYVGEYQELTDKKKNEYDENSLISYTECLESLITLGSRRDLSAEELVLFEEAIRENIAIESLYANPDDPQKVVSIARTKICQVVKILFDNIYEETNISDIYDFINQNSGTVSIKSELEDMLKYFRFIVKYKNIGRTEPINE